MVIKNFLLVCKTANGAVYVSDMLYSGPELQEDLIRLSSLDVAVLDVIPIEVDLSEYVH